MILSFPGGFSFLSEEVELASVRDCDNLTNKTFLYIAFILNVIT